MRSRLGPTLVAAGLAALLWLAIGLVQRVRAGADPVQALLAELPLTALVFVGAAVFVSLRRR